MSNVKSDLLIENENLFRALAYGPIAILLVLFAGDFLMSSGIVLFKVIYVLMALYFTLSTLAYAAYYTNELYEGNAESLIKNENLLKTLICTPLAILFWFFAVNSMMSSSHIVINVITVLIALYFSLGTLAYAAFYTNDYHAETV
ncbi:MAG: hypothetical protein HRT52_21605 [Colwellia sp.]|nr:hypothetical protein [Colwellia sp.]